MFKAVIGSFPSQEAAQEAVVRLRETGFPGEHMALVARDPIGSADVADVSLPTTGNGIIALLAILFGIIGVLVGLAIGYTTNSAVTTIAGGGLSPGIVPYGLVGAGAGLIVGIIIGFLIATGARRAERRWRRLYGRRREAVLAVATDAGNAPKARKILADTGAFEVRSGGLSEQGEFAFHAVPVAPESYGERPPIAEAPVTAGYERSIIDRPADNQQPPEKG